MIKNPAPVRTSRVPTWLRVLLPVTLILVWFGLFGAGGASFGQISAVSTNDQSQQLPASAEATKVQELQAHFTSDDVIPALVVYEREGGLTDADLARIDHDIASFGKLGGVLPGGSSPAILSDDGEAAEVVMVLDTGVKIAGTVELLRGVLDDNAVDGLTTAITGPAGLTADLTGAFAGIDSLLLLVALSAVFLILVIVYRSPLLPVIVLFSSLSALCAAILVVVQLAKADILLLSGQTQGILFILVIGAATDYSLLYIARFREALAVQPTKWTATWAALKGSWEPIVASGGTVIAALLLLLLFSDLNSNKALGPVASIGIIFALLASLTLLPALLFWAGKVAFWPIRPKAVPENDNPIGEDKKGLWPWLARSILTRPRILWISSVLLLVVMSLGVFQLKADGVAASEFVLGESQARDGQAVLADHFPAGSGSPTVIIAPEDELDAVSGIVLGTDGVDSLTVLSEDSPSGSLAVTDDGVQPLGPPGTPVPDVTVVDGNILLSATLLDAGDSIAAEDVVVNLRAELADISTESAPVLVGGTTAIALDSNTTAIHDRNLLIPLILGAITLILMILLRSIVAPLILIASVVLSFGAALGVSAWVFNGIFDLPGADPSVPLFGFVFLVALGVDYNIFLMTRVREESRKHGTRHGILRGLAVTGGVITSAGLVLAATFAALGVLPILFLLQIAFIVAFGVLLDTFLVRTVLVPALSYDIGRAIWWPSALSRGVHRAVPTKPDREDTLTPVGAP
ncbi:MMPL family transporter [Mycetocola miduiensis]|uniref:Putative drug exporter of the RND superfamily n=1 Tax=Mycetocola miduiensis TaxID=995034 RepID=A0A1I5BU42_9MICO|nr:MMPL family transporter [Mycetocola miduiensis]SFN78276.1 putative drug exporter of the RND superfamily [Mycetocola miduiensis]